MKKITKLSLYRALKGLVLFSASTHLVLLFIEFLRTYDFELLNYFNIIDLDLFLPEISNGGVSQIISLGVIILLYYTLYAHYRYTGHHAYRHKNGRQ